MMVLMTIEHLVALENWELARQFLVEQAEDGNEEAIAFKTQLEEEFNIDLSDLSAIGSLPVPAIMGLSKKLIDHAMDAVRNIESQLRQKICVEMNYCNKKNQGVWRYAEYAAAVADIFGGSGAVSLAVLLAKNQFLDKLCGC